MAHILASLTFAIVALAALGLIAVMLLQARVAIASALGLHDAPDVRRYLAPVRVKVRRTATWAPAIPAPSRGLEIRRAA